MLFLYLLRELGRGTQMYPAARRKRGRESRAQGSSRSPRCRFREWVRRVSTLSSQEFRAPISSSSVSDMFQESCPNRPAWRCIVSALQIEHDGRQRACRRARYDGSSRRVVAAIVVLEVQVHRGRTMKPRSAKNPTDRPALGRQQVELLAVVVVIGSDIGESGVAVGDARVEVLDVPSVVVLDSRSTNETPCHCRMSCADPSCTDPRHWC